MTYKESWMLFNSELRNYTAIAPLHPREFMRWFTEAQTEMQNRSLIVRRSESVDVNAGDASTDYSFRWKHIISVVDEANSREYALVSIHEFQDIVGAMAPSTQTNRVIPWTVPMRPVTKQFDAVVAFDGRKMYAYPVPDKKITLTVWHNPLLPQFTSDIELDNYWADWWNPTDLNDDAPFMLQWNGDPSASPDPVPAAKPEREFFAYNRGLVEYAKARFLEGIPGDQIAVHQSDRSFALFDRYCEEAKKERGTNMRSGVAAYALNE
jgi:hypothetical protein